MIRSIRSVGCGRPQSSCPNGRSPFLRLGLMLLVGVLGWPCRADGVDVPALVRAINAVGPKGAGHRKAQAAWNRLVRAEADEIPEILAGMDDSARLAVNWLRAAVDVIAHRALDGGDTLPRAELEHFVLDTRHAAKARRTAYELLLAIDPGVRDRLIPSMLHDPSMEMRRDAVGHALATAERLLESGARRRALAEYRKALDAARDLDQIDEAAERLRALGQTVDLPRHFGFIMRWRLIGPFDNSNKGGFDVAYGPEVDATPADQYPGKEGPVRWIDYTTEDPYGKVDLNKALGRFKGAVAYAYAEFLSDAERDAELRLGSTNANKLWLNGQLLSANHVYHSGAFIDQYVGKGRLKKGKNVILVKILQNEQSESWAQGWEFQLRVCDQYGTAILSQDRQQQGARRLAPNRTTPK